MKNKNLLTHAQHVLLAKAAWDLASHAQIMGKCLPEELGTPVAEDFAEAGMQAAIEAANAFAKIKTSLRIARVNDAAKQKADLAFAACRSIRFAVVNASRHGGEFNLNDLLAADKFARDALGTTTAKKGGAS